MTILASSVYTLATSVPLTPREALSGVFGSISLAAWIFLLVRTARIPDAAAAGKVAKRNNKVPQLIENYQQQSASGVSLLFLFVWFLGDVANLLGAVWARLVPTIIAIAIYFCFADAIIIVQCLYYNLLNARRDNRDAQRKPFGDGVNGDAVVNGDANGDAFGEDAPLLGRQRSESSVALPGSRQRSSVVSRRRRSTLSRRDSLERVMGANKGGAAWIKNTVSILLVCAAGAAGWAIAWRAGVWKPTPLEGGKETAETDTPLGAEILGYASAVLYLGARIPQIIKNQRERSCEGLSLLFFMLSLLGNGTYGAGVGLRWTSTLFEL
ncbi:MAG: hypothetical protein Q9165_000613 [Trypethelium subeluteriae]